MCSLSPLSPLLDARGQPPPFLSPPHLPLPSTTPFLLCAPLPGRASRRGAPSRPVRPETPPPPHPSPHHAVSPLSNLGVPFPLARAVLPSAIVDSVVAPRRKSKNTHLQAQVGCFSARPGLTGAVVVAAEMAHATPDLDPHKRKRDAEDNGPQYHLPLSTTSHQGTPSVVFSRGSHCSCRPPLPSTVSQETRRKERSKKKRKSDTVRLGKTLRDHRRHDMGM